MKVSFQSIGLVCVTALTTSSISAGTPCRFNVNDMVLPCVNGEPIHGIAQHMGQGLVTLAVRGFVTVPYSGEMPKLGYCPLAAAADGKVKMADGAREYLVTNVNSTDSTVTFLL